MSLRHPNAARAGDDFFIGWQQRMPKSCFTWTMRVTLVLILVSAGAMAVVRLGLANQEAGTFEFGSSRAVTGVFMVEPVPMLLLDEPLDGRDAAILVGLFKFGVPESLRRLHGQRVRFNGTAIRNPAGLMIEVTDADSIVVLDPAAAPGARSASHRIVGEVTLIGELVDTKCFFGVMRPGYGKVHRACAVRCLSGGVPPGLLLRDAAGLATVVMLRSASTPIDPQWAARILRVSGQLSVSDGIIVLSARTIERADEH